MEYNKEEILNLYSEELTITDIAKKYTKLKGGEYTDSVRRRISKIINENVDRDTVTEPRKKEEKSTSEEVVFMPSAWDTSLNRFLSIEEYCERFNLDLESIEKYNLVSHVSSHMIYNCRFKPTLREVTGITEEWLEETIKKYSEPQEALIPPTMTENYWVDRLVYTDVHIAMDVNGDGSPLYEGRWDEESLMDRQATMIQHVIEHGRGDTLIIDDLGDFLDGLDGETTRKGHKLPQNMNNKQAFELAIKFKVSLVDTLMKVYSNIICHNVTEDNHSGNFGYFANFAVKQILENKYPDRVKVNNFERFIEHYKIGKHTFVISHGKDSSNLKFGFKPQLDTKQAEKIDQYCKEYKLYDGNYIEFSKGDSHQGIFDDTTSNDFTYYSYPAFSPPSDWVKTNFKNSKSGFVLYNIDKRSQIKVKIPYYFDN